MTIRDFFENYYDGQGPVCVIHAMRASGVRAFWVDQGLANSHSLLPGFLKSKLGEKLNDFMVTYYQRHVDLESDDGNEEKISWHVVVRRETYGYVRLEEYAKKTTTVAELKVYNRCEGKKED